MNRIKVTEKIVTWADGTADTQRECSDCCTNQCVKPIHKERYRVIKKRIQAENQGYCGIRINEDGTYMLDDEYETRYPSENNSREFKG